MISAAVAALVAAERPIQHAATAAWAPADVHAAAQAPPAHATAIADGLPPSRTVPSGHSRLHESVAYEFFAAAASRRVDAA